MTCSEVTQKTGPLYTNFRESTRATLLFLLERGIFFMKRI